MKNAITTQECLAEATAKVESYLKPKTRRDETRINQVLASLKDWRNSEQLKMHPVALTLAAAAAEIESLVKNLQTCERKAEEILEHTTGGERTRKAALEIRIAAVAHDL